MKGISLSSKLRANELVGIVKLAFNIPLLSNMAEELCSSSEDFISDD